MTSRRVSNRMPVVPERESSDTSFATSFAVSGKGRSTTQTASRMRHTPYPRVVGHALVAFAKLRVREWDRALRRLEESQTEQLLDICRHAKNTEFGRKHDLGSVRNHADFRGRVPVGDYDAFSPAIERMRAGEKGILVPEFVRYFGNSSGSSTQGKSKFLPISERQIRFQQANGSDALMRYLAFSEDAELTRGFSLGLFPPSTMREEGPVLITSNPALMQTRMPLLSRPLLLPDEGVKQIPDYDRKLAAIAASCFEHDVRSVGGTTCWFTLLFDKVLAEAARRGHPAKSVKEVWPNLRVLFGGGVSKDPYLPILEERLGRRDFVLVDTYNATEGGVYACSDHSGARGMLMIPDRGVFFEFVPLEERDKPNARRVPLWEVERDVLYSLVVTTPSGLYSYEIGDIVRFPSTRPPRMEFAGRLAGCLSTTQELTTHVEIESGVEHALREVPSKVVDFGAGADVGVNDTAKSRYVLFVEFAEGATPNDLSAFASSFDAGLCKANRVYREHRKGDSAILPPEVVVLKNGSTQRYLKEVSGGNVQTKFPRIVSDQRKNVLRTYAGRSAFAAAADAASPN